MYLTRIALNIEKKKTMRALSSPNLFHGAIDSSFSGDRPKVLWRIDNLGGRYYILILSHETTDFTSFIEQFGYNGDKAETRAYDKLLDRVEVGSKWIFRLNANPTYREYSKDGDKRGKRKACKNVQAQHKWLINNCEKYGFKLTDGSFKVVGDKWYIFSKNGESSIVTIRAVTYEGVLEVENEALFKEALCGGIGREKAYGLGLLTLVKYNG